MAEVNEMGKLPEGWKRVRLGNAIEYEQPQKYLVKSEKYDERTGIPVLTAGKSFILGYTEEQFGIYNTIPAIIFDDFTTDSRYVNFPFKLKSSAIKILKTKDNNNDLFFIYNVMQILNFNPGSEHKRYWISEYSKISIPLPPLPEQRKIAESLETVDNAIEKTDRIIEKHKRIKQGLMQDLLTRGIDENGEIRREETHRFKDSELGRIPEEWEVVEFKEICKVRQGLQIAIANRFKEPGPKRFIYITIQYLNSEDKDKDVEYIQNPPKSVICRKYDLLMTRTGNTGMVITNVEGVFHNNFFLVEYNKKKIGKIYLFYYLNLSWIQEAIRALAGTTTIPDLNHRDFYSLKFLKPSLPEQHRIVSILSQIDETIKKEQQYKAKLERLKWGLMEDLLTGKVRVNHLIEEGVKNVP